MFIYLIVNHITGKYYVGQHKGNNLKKYLQDKFSRAKTYTGSSHLFASMRKHGREAFSIHALLSVETKAELDQKEREFIEFLRSKNPEYGYNICRGGEGFTGPHRPESKAKVTEALKKRWAQPGFKEHWTEIMTGHDTSPETIEKIKIARALQDETPRIEALRKWAKEHPEEMATRMSHDTHVLGGKAGSREAKQKAAQASIASGSIIKAQHTRWHVNRGVINPSCQLCVPTIGGV
jgi:group I intron endonuclease